MKKAKLAFLMAGIMLLTAFGAISVNAAEYNVNNVNEVQQSGDIHPLNITGVLVYVYNKKTNESVEGAKVFMIWKEKVHYYLLEKIFHKNFIRWAMMFDAGSTNSDGFYHYPAVSPGTTVTIIVSKSGYIPSIQKVFFPSDWEAVDAMFYLNPIS